MKAITTFLGKVSPYVLLLVGLIVTIVSGVLLHDAEAAKQPYAGFWLLILVGIALIVYALDHIFNRSSTTATAAPPVAGSGSGTGGKPTTQTK